VVTATSLGIIVDATVHFLSKYQRARRTTGADAEAAVRYAFSTVGTALWVTTAVLIAGFAVLSLSTFEINAALGQLTALTLFMGIVADFLLLPTLLLLLAGRGDRDRTSTLPTVQQAAE
jgi:predicted RND superfamily exporter protein